MGGVDSLIRSPDPAPPGQVWPGGRGRYCLVMLMRCCHVPCCNYQRTQIWLLFSWYRDKSNIEKMSLSGCTDYKSLLNVTRKDALLEPYVLMKPLMNVNEG